MGRTHVCVVLSNPQQYFLCVIWLEKPVSVDEVGSSYSVRAMVLFAFPCGRAGGRAGAEVEVCVEITSSPRALIVAAQDYEVGHAVLAVIPSQLGRFAEVVVFLSWRLILIGLPFWSSRHSTVFCSSKKAGGACIRTRKSNENRSKHTKLLWLELLLLSISVGSKCDGSLSQSPTPVPRRQRATRSGPVSTSMHGVYRFEPRGSPSLGWEGSIFYFGYHIFQSTLVNK